jgi:hypothetical protein
MFAASHSFLIKEKPIVKTSLQVCLILLLCAGAAVAQKTKPWTEWSDKDADKVLNDSGWGQTQTESDSSSQQSSQTSAITSTTAARREDSNISAAAKIESGEKKDASVVHYYVRFLTAKPIRAAFVRKVELQKAPADKVAQMRAFVECDFGDFVVITVTMDGNDRKKMTAAAQSLTGATAAILKATTYLERKDGKRVELLDYRAPTQDGLGAKFVFPRIVEGLPLIGENTGEVRFVAELGKVKIVRRFKVSEMMYEGKLEY